MEIRKKFIDANGRGRRYVIKMKSCASSKYIKNGFVGKGQNYECNDYVSNDIERGEHQKYASSKSDN